MERPTGLDAGGVSRIDRLEEKLDRVMESSIRTEEQVKLVYTLLEQHDAKAVRAVEAAARANDRVEALENMFHIPFKWVKIVAAIAGAVTAVVGAWKLLQEETE
jgi:hypothetical protein